ncbi:tetratricopeptide repeat protein [Paraglaciecola aquimarina]|uniref:Tetratricopeptide repeat protein n=1 Tax=Paraglaciecola aquimarina TaxID=1235557 RepID=A0ABU3SWZ5_9ALTE|nr:tetratricopeptide repeat protein [Paraglaciecola aquimarina]MDU0354529.1 tetratricopeptide repeat protein [Paraglaciecola aquimarina]
MLVTQAKLDIIKGKNQDAVTLLWSVLNLDTNYLPAYSQLYQLSNQGFGTEKFVNHVEKILIAQPDRSTMRNLLADTYLQNGQRDKAIFHYQKLQQLKHYPNAAAVLNNLAFMAIDQDLSKALDLVNQGLAIAPKSASLLDTKGWITAQQGQYDQALELLRQAYSTDSNDPSIRYHIAYTLNKLGRVNEAKLTLEQAFDLNIPFIEAEAAKSLQQSL